MSSSSSNPSAVPSARPCVVAPAEQERWFKEEVHLHDGQLKSWLRGTFPSVRDVDDVVQESYLRIWKAKTSGSIASAKSFLFMVARNLALDFVRRNRRSPIDSASDLTTMEVLDHSLSADEAAILQEKLNLLSESIIALPKRRRDVLILCKIKRRSYQEAADELGISKRTVENLLARAVDDCEQYLRSHGLHGFERHDPR